MPLDNTPTDRPVDEDIVDVVLDHWFTVEPNPDPSWPSTIRSTLRAIEDAGYQIVMKPVAGEGEAICVCGQIIERPLIDELVECSRCGAECGGR